jgi:copper chaperone
MSRLKIPSHPQPEQENTMSPQTQTFQVQGMTCGHCEKAVNTAIRTLDPQAEVRIDRTQNRVEVTSSQAREAIAEAIREEGYTVGA